MCGRGLWKDPNLSPHTTPLVRAGLSVSVAPPATQAENSVQYATALDIVLTRHTVLHAAAHRNGAPSSLTSRSQPSPAIVWRAHSYV